MIKVLSSGAWREFRGVPSRSGLNTTSHVALISNGVDPDRKCFLKLINLEQSPGLLCEGLGWIFAKSAGIQVPEFSAIVLVPLDRLRQSIQLPIWLDGYLEYPAWCVEVVDGKSMAAVHKWIYWLRRKQCLNAKETPMLASFDIWTDNRDRNYGNVIRTKKGEYLAIDHESLLHDLIVKGIYGVEFAERSLLEEARQHLKPDKFLKFQCDMANAAYEHVSALQSGSQDAEHYVSTIISDTEQAHWLWQHIYNYLYIRAQSGWLSEVLGVTV